MLKDESKELYETDHYAWLQVGIKQAEHFGLTEIADHLEEMSRSEKRAIKSKLVVLIAHLLKWKYQPDHQTTSWRSSIKFSRKDLKDHIKDSPSIRPQLDSLAKDGYELAVAWASKETGLDESDFPQQLEFTLEQLLDEGYFP